MKSFLRFVLILAGIALISAALAPVLHTFLPYKFERIFNRIMMIGTLLAVGLFVRIRYETLQQYGLVWKNRISLSYFFTGFVTGVTALGLLAGLKILLGQAVWAPADLSLGALFLKMAGVFGAAILIGVIEEFFFRGFVFQSLKRYSFLKTAGSVGITSLFYSLLHFVSFKKIYIGSNPDFFDGLKLIVAPFLSIKHFALFWHEAFGLFVFGIVLNLIAIKSRSLYPAIGLHAGCVFFVKMDGTFLNDLTKNVYFFSSSKMYDGLLGWVFLIGIGWVLHRLLRHADSSIKLNSAN